MVSINCFCSSYRKKKKDEEVGTNSVRSLGYGSKSAKTVHVKLEHLGKSSEKAYESKPTSTTFSIPVPFHSGGSCRCNVKVVNDDTTIEAHTGEVDYEGGDEHDDDENQTKRRDCSNCSENLLDQEKYVNIERARKLSCSKHMDHDEGDDDDDEQGHSGHLSDPGTGKAEFWASPKLKRSCSSLDVRTHRELPPSRSKSYEEMQRLAETYRKEVIGGEYGMSSPVSVMSRCSADKVMLKKHSSSQILPSRSRKLWWKLFLWSHRNLHKARQQVEIKPSNQGGYSSDTVEPRQAMESNKMMMRLNPEQVVDNNQSWDGFNGVSGLWPQNQWIAFPIYSRVDEWVKEASVQPPLHHPPRENHDDYVEDGDGMKAEDNASPPAARGSSQMTQMKHIPEDISHANITIQSLNASSTVAHITGIGLKVIPPISLFSSLRTVNLSSNFIAQITPGSLPKGLHILNLSRNNISTIEGLRELTRLRVLDLSYNRISRIGQGLSNCTLIKELYLSANKVSYVEGLHRLLKLSVLDLSFNKITTTKALGQLVANYNSLVALNLLGNPIQSNISDDQLQKTLCGLLPKLTFLNKQPINPQKAREIHVDAIAKAALGSSSRATRRKAVKRVSHASSSTSTMRRNNVNKNKQRSKSRPHHHSADKDK